MFKLCVKSKMFHGIVWVTLPMDEDELYSKLVNIGITPEESEELAEIIYCRNPFGYEIENADLLDLNGMAGALESMDDDYLGAVDALLNKGGYSLEDAMDKVLSGEVYIYEGCDTVGDIARYIVDTNHFLCNVPDFMKHFDYEAYGRELASKCKFYFKNGNAYEIEPTEEQ